MVDQEAIRLVRELAVTTEFRAVGLRVFTGVGEEQAFLVARVLEDITESGVGLLGGGVCGDVERGTDEEVVVDLIGLDGGRGGEGGFVAS